VVAVLGDTVGGQAVDTAGVLRIERDGEPCDALKPCDALYRGEAVVVQEPAVNSAAGVLARAPGPAGPVQRIAGALIWPGRIAAVRPTG
jgi:hypothetical protein